MTIERRAQSLFQAALKGSAAAANTEEQLARAREYVVQSNKPGEVKERALAKLDDFLVYFPSIRGEDAPPPRVDVARGRYFARLAETLRADPQGDWTDERIDGLFRSASNVAKLFISDKEGSHRGLVMGYVQSGKTAHFTALSAICADEGFPLVVVLTANSKSLRAQTHARLERDLPVEPGSGNGWRAIPHVPSGLASEAHWARLASSDVRTTDDVAGLANGPVIAVCKKHQTRLNSLAQLVKRARARGDLAMHQSILVIDDEADQASPPGGSSQANTVSSRIVELLNECEPVTYVGYTATPFANFFIDREHPLFPRTFIETIDHGEGYFGATEFFDVEASAARGSGVGLVRLISDEQAADFSRGRLRGPAAPGYRWNESIENAILWFWIATAIRDIRGGAECQASSMLVHTGFGVAEHQAMAHLIERRQQHLADTVLGEVGRRVFELEVGRSREMFPSSNLPAWPEVRDQVEAVIARTQVAIDNSKSSTRLDYSGDRPIAVIAVGGNTLSRGLTLKGLVVSFFCRQGKAYDTLMQMGRWFGYREGYADLQRLWTTSDLQSKFRRITEVEEEVREMIAEGKREGVTPEDMRLAVRVHPGMIVTSKMGAARLEPDAISLGTGHPVYPLAVHSDPDRLNANLDRLACLVDSVPQNKWDDRVPSAYLTTSIESAEVGRFLCTYDYIDEGSARFNSEVMKRYIAEEQVAEGGPLEWTVAVIRSQRVAGTRDVAVGNWMRIVPEQRGAERTQDEHVVRFRAVHEPDDKWLGLAEDAKLRAEGTTFPAAAKLRANELGTRAALLVVYVIDRLSGTESDQLVPLALEQDIVVPVVIFPYRLIAKQGALVAVND